MTTRVRQRLELSNGISIGPASAADVRPGHLLLFSTDGSSLSLRDNSGGVAGVTSSVTAPPAPRIVSAGTGTVVLDTYDRVVLADLTAGDVYIQVPLAGDVAPGTRVLIAEKNGQASNNLIYISPTAPDILAGDPAGMVLPARGSAELLAFGAGGWLLV